MQQILQIPSVMLLNDFVAVGYGLLALGPKDLEPLNDCMRVPMAPMACIGAGTGLGEAYLTFNGVNYDVWPSEGGHSSFAPRQDLEYELLKFIRTSERYVIWI